MSDCALSKARKTICVGHNTQTRAVVDACRWTILASHVSLKLLPEQLAVIGTEIATSPTLEISPYSIGSTRRKVTHTRYTTNRYSGSDGDWG